MRTQTERDCGIFYRIGNHEIESIGRDIIIGQRCQPRDIQGLQTTLKGRDETLEIILQISRPEEDTFRKEVLSRKDQHTKDHISIKSSMDLEIVYSTIEILILYVRGKKSRIRSCSNVFE